MELNQFLFPAPRTSYTSQGYIGEIIYIPRYNKNSQGNIVPFKLQRRKIGSYPSEAAFNLVGKETDQSQLDLNNAFSNEQNELLPQTPKKLNKEQINAVIKNPQLSSTDKINLLREQKQFMQTKSKSNSVLANKYRDNSQDDYLSPSIPCLYLPYAGGSSKLLIYFHGNAEDIGLSMELLSYLKDMLKVHILSMEYPGYGIYQGESNAQQISLDAFNVFDYLVQAQGLKESDIILFGRSIGSGPATLVASERMPCALLLMSAFTSIRDVVNQQAGNLLKYLVGDRFRNIDHIKNVKSPTFLVHGQRDQLISPAHSQQLTANCGGPVSLIMPRIMDHNEFDFVEDLISPFYNFMCQCQITTEPDNNDPFCGQFAFPEELYVPPPKMRKTDQSTSLYSWIVMKMM